MMKEYLVCSWALPPMRFGWFLKSYRLFHYAMSCIKEGAYNLSSKWHSSNLCPTPNPMFNGQILPRHCVISSTHMDSCREVCQDEVLYLECFIILLASTSLSRVKTTPKMGLSCSGYRPTLFGLLTTFIPFHYFKAFKQDNLILFHSFIFPYLNAFYFFSVSLKFIHSISSQKNKYSFHLFMKSQRKYYILIIYIYIYICKDQIWVLSPDNEWT